jgi:hypothetical protein
MGLERPGNRLVMAIEGSAGRPQPPWGLADRIERLMPVHPASEELAAYWRKKAAGAALPRRDDIVAAEIPRLLPHLAVLDPVAGAGDWSYRLVGTALSRRYGYDWTGKRLTEVFNQPTAATLIALYDRVAATRTPSFITGRAEVTNREHVVYETATLPILGRDGATVWMLLGVFFFN